MKSLQDFKSTTISEAEEKDRRQFDMLVRAGLANKAQLQRIHKILDKMGEERPVFNNADRMILQNLFNKMVDLISNHPQITTKVRQVVREDEEFENEILAEEPEQLDEVTSLPSDPPAVLVLKRKAIRLYPNGMRIALYHNDRLNKIFSVPYGTSESSPIQAEETIHESVMDHLHKIVAEKQARSVKFANGQTRKVDGYTASAIVQVHKALNDENKKKIADMVHKSPEHFEKVAKFAFSKVK